MNCVHFFRKFTAMWNSLLFVTTGLEDKRDTGGITCLFQDGCVLSCLHNPQFVPDLSRRFSKFYWPLKWAEAELLKYRLPVKLILSPSSTESLLFQAMENSWLWLNIALSFRVCMSPEIQSETQQVCEPSVTETNKQIPPPPRQNKKREKKEKIYWTLGMWNCQSSQSLSIWKRMFLWHEKISCQ